MDKVSLTVQMRDTSVKAKVLRRENIIPAEFYGKGEENLSIQMDYQTFRRLYREGGDNTVIDLEIEGKGKKKVLVHGLEYHPVTDEFIHVDFINVDMNVEVTAHVNINLEGQAPAVKELAGVLNQSLDAIEIKCLPGDLIHEVTLSIDGLVDFHTSLHVSDIELPKNITLITDPAITVATVSAQREEEVDPEPGAEVDVASVEVTSEKTDEAAPAA
ncbi:MAG: large subunit ribosomal protein L25 [Oceanicoccus sp.]|jgi:large subunit ribosomal protein L25